MHALRVLVFIAKQNYCNLRIFERETIPVLLVSIWSFGMQVLRWIEQAWHSLQRPELFVPVIVVTRAMYVLRLPDMLLCAHGLRKNWAIPKPHLAICRQELLGCCQRYETIWNMSCTETASRSRCHALRPSRYAVRMLIEVLSAMNTRKTLEFRHSKSCTHHENGLNMSQYTRHQPKTERFML